MTIDLAAFLADTIKMATPLIFAALAALLNRHAGMFNMGVEGMILCSALGAATGAHFLGNVWLGLLCLQPPDRKNRPLSDLYSLQPDGDGRYGLRYVSDDR